jgi:enterochelin esterase-like enzyme
MKTTLFLASLALLSLPVSSQAEEKAERTVVWNNPVEFTEPGLTHHVFRSDAMKVEVGYSVWLPPGYDTSGARYPVIYFLHGSGGTESADAPAFSHMLAERVAAKKIPPVIAVFPNGGLSGYRDQPEGNIKVETMIIGELIPLIDRTFRTQRDRVGRVLGGFSMGGGGSVRFALKYPEMFSAAASWAGAFFRRNGDNSFVPTFDTELLVSPKAQVRLLLIVGYDDLTYPAHVPALAALQSAKYPFTIHTIAGLGHELGRYYSLTGDELIGFLTKEFATAPSP